MSAIPNRLTLRTVLSPLGDITKASVLSSAELDNNFLSLKARDIKNVGLSGQTLYLDTEYNGTFTVNLSGLTSGSSTTDYFVTGGTLSGQTIILTRNDGNTVEIDLSPLFTGSTNTYDTTILVTGSSVNNYIGISDPTISAYSLNHIYIVEFLSGNTSTGSTIDINGLGVLDILKPTEDGLSILDEGDIVTGVSYYMIYNGSEMQLTLYAPTDDCCCYNSWKGPTQVVVGAVSAGTVFNCATPQQVFDAMFYRYANPTFTNFYINQFTPYHVAGAPLFEVGFTITAGSRNFIWSESNAINVRNNSIVIKGNNSLYPPNPAGVISSPFIPSGTTWTGITNDFSESISIGPITRTTPGSYYWRIFGQNTNNSLMSPRSYTANWRFRRYWGTSVDTIPTPSTITGLTSSDLNGNSFYGNPYSSSPTTTYFSTSGVPGTYKYICFPTSIGSYPSNFKDDLTLFNMVMADSSDGFNSSANGWNYYLVTGVTNQYGVTTNYACYRSKYQLGGDINIRVF